jgi:pyruvate kinase
MELARPVNKPVYVDLKGKQLRVIEWANLPEGPILLNHKVEVELPARVYFRGDDRCELRKIVDGNQLFVDPLPKAPVGRGQAVNIVSKKIVIDGGLTKLDHEYIRAAMAEGLSNFLLSFVESWDDVAELEEAIARYSKGSKVEPQIGLKIESQAGVDFVKGADRKKFGERYRLMAARDDLMIQVGLLKMPDALRAIIKKDPKAICASRLLLGLESGAVSLADVSDILYMRELGYERFMLSDGISRDHGQEAFDFWQKCYS